MKNFEHGLIADRQKPVFIENASKYIKETDSGAILSKRDDSSTLPEKEKPLTNQGLKDGAGEEGRTPDLMLGKHTL